MEDGNANHPRYPCLAHAVDERQMKTIDRRVVQTTLRKLGSQPVGRGNSSGHEIWRDASGHSIRPVFRKRDVHIASVYALGAELEVKGICPRATFMEALRDA